MAKRAMDGMLPHTGVPKHTHWSHKLPNRWLLCAWLVAISSAVWCSCAKQVGPWFCWNLCSSIWCLLAQRAERQRLPKQGWINRARLVGSKRVRGAWQKKGRQSRRRRAYRVALWIGLHGAVGQLHETGPVLRLCRGPAPTSSLEHISQEKESMDACEKWQSCIHTKKKESIQARRS